MQTENEHKNEIKSTKAYTIEEFNSAAINFRCAIWRNEIERFIYPCVVSYELYSALNLNTTNK